MGEVVALHGVTPRSISEADQALYEAIASDLDKVLILGIARDGSLYCDASPAAAADVNLMLDLGKARILDFAKDA